jgi:hypothetical protein
VANAGAYTTFTNNVIIGNSTVPHYVNALYIGGDSARYTTMYNNTIIGKSGIGTVIEFDVEGPMTFKNNIVVGPGGMKMTYFDTHFSGWVSDYNDWQGTGNFEVGTFGNYSSLAAFGSAMGSDSHSIASDPSFTTNYTDLHLRSTSPCINTGTNIGPTTDFDGNLISGIPDIGAYEYHGTPPAPSFPVGSFAASPDTLFKGGLVTLTWTDSNATSASINNGVGSVSTKGGKMSVTADTSKTFILTLINSTGSRSYNAPITVLSPAPSPPVGSFSASPDTLFKGDLVSLTWTDSNATSASINNGVGSVSTKGGKMSVTADTSKTFILTLTNSAGSRNYKATITVLAPVSGFPVGSFSASPDTLVTSGVVTLTWTNSNATSASIDNGVGSVSIKSGSLSVTADTTVTFILTLTNSAGSRNYKATITVLSPARGTASSPRPVEYSLRQNYPNPFNPSTTIRYEVPWASHVTITVYDMLGRQVSVLVNEMREAGVHEVKFDASNLASGVYFYFLRAGSFVDTKRLLLLR